MTGGVDKKSERRAFSKKKKIVSTPEYGLRDESYKAYWHNICLFR